MDIDYTPDYSTTSSDNIRSTQSLDLLDETTKKSLDEWDSTKQLSSGTPVP